MANDICLNGCTPVPLAHYLKALGVLRLISEQKDPDAAGYWDNERFVLRTQLNKDELLGFFLDEYRPTPIVAPWNGGSGFYKDDKNNRSALLIVRDSIAPRLSHLRQAIKESESVLSSLGLVQKPNDEKSKDNLITTLRATISDTSINWLDATISLTTKGRKAVPLLGKGGNEGRLEFSNNFLQKLALVIDVNHDDSSEQVRSFTTRAYKWLETALFGIATPLLEKGSPGMLLPFASGGPNATTGFEADSKSTSFINPWDYVLMLEGAIVFVSAATRRLESHADSSLSSSFIVKAEGAGHGGLTLADRNQAHDEVWLPIWKKPINYVELRFLFSEGRATINKRNAMNGLDFARAIAGLGVDRGIHEFLRIGFLERRAPGQGYYVTAPLGRFYVRKNDQAGLIADLEQSYFLTRLREFAVDKKKGASGSLVSLVNQLENRLFDLTRGGSSKAVQETLIVIGKLHRTLSVSAKGQKAVSAPIAGLKPEWVLKADDGSAEFRLACALANIQAKNLPMRLHFSATGMEKGSKWVWDAESRLAVWGEGPFERNMAALLRSRLLAAERMQSQDKPFAFHFGASSGDIAAFLAQSTDDRRIGELAQGLALIKDDDFPRHLGDKGYREQSGLPAAYAVLKPFFVEDQVLRKIGFLPEDAKLPQPPELLAWLAAGHTERAVALGWSKLRQAGISLPGFPNQSPMPIGIGGERLLATLAIPVAFGDLARLLRSIARE